MELSAIESEVNKLTYKVPQNLLTPWERGFAGVVLDNRPQVLNVKHLDGKVWRSSMMEGVVEESKPDEPPEKLGPSFRGGGRGRRGRLQK